MNFFLVISRQALYVLPVKKRNKNQFCLVKTNQNKQVIKK